MKDSKINWTDHTANFWWGCFKVSDGCKNCYAETLSKRYGKSIWGPPAITEREYKKAVWQDILKWDAEAARDGVRRRVFVSSMSDFLEDHPQVEPRREQAKAVIRQLTHLDVLLLTKRPENAERFLGDWFEDWPEHVWMGTTVENNEMVIKRIPLMYRIPARVRFVSVEPMLGPVNIGVSGVYIDWFICGGESGPRARPFDWDWARDLRDQCKAANVAFWMKQGGGLRPPHELEDIPEDLRIRELPTRTACPH